MVTLVNLIEQTRTEVAAEVRAAMGRHRVTQAALAEKIGVSRATLSERVSGARAFTTDELVVICEVLGLDFLTLFSAATSHVEEGAA